MHAFTITITTQLAWFPFKSKSRCRFVERLMSLFSELGPTFQQIQVARGRLFCWQITSEQVIYEEAAWAGERLDCGILHP